VLLGVYFKGSVLVILLTLFPMELKRDSRLFIGVAVSVESADRVMPATRRLVASTTSIYSL